MSRSDALPELHVLVVDDNPGDIQLVELVFREIPARVQVSSAGNGREGLEYLDQAGSGLLPDLILLDLNMPEMSGWELLRWIRSDRRLVGLRVVIFSTSESPRDRELGVEFGADDFATKPARYQQLREFLESLVERFARRPLDGGAVP